MKKFFRTMNSCISVIDRQCRRDIHLYTFITRELDRCTQDKYENLLKRQSSLHREIVEMVEILEELDTIRYEGVMELIERNELKTLLFELRTDVWGNRIK